MLIRKIIRTCANESVAQAAVASIGRRFAGDVRDTADSNGMTVGGFTALSIKRFVRKGDEAELRLVVAAMDKAQEPILAGLRRIMCSELAAPFGR